MKDKCDDCKKYWEENPDKAEKGEYAAGEIAGLVLNKMKQVGQSICEYGGRPRDLSTSYSMYQCPKCQRFWLLLQDYETGFKGRFAKPVFL